MYPQGEIPVLDDNGVIIGERYVTDTFTSLLFICCQAWENNNNIFLKPVQFIN